MRILMYHEVVEGEPEEIHAVQAGQFRAQMGWLHTSGYRVVDLESWVETGMPNWRDAVALTFDDGYQDNYTVAWPVLQEHGFPASVFLVTGCVGGTSRWREGALGQAPMLTWGQAREMAGGVAFGAHSVSHPHLTRLDGDEACRELLRSRDQIEQSLGRPVSSFAYPYSDLNPEIKRMAAAAGFRLACTYEPGYVGAGGTDALELERVGILATDTLADFCGKVRGALRWRASWWRRRARRRVRGLVGRGGA